MKPGLRLLFVCLAAALFAGVYLTRSHAQSKSKIVSHFTKEHRTGKYNDCQACHVVPTPNWTRPRRDKDQPFPDVADFPVGYDKKGRPDHSACNECHSMHSSPTFCAGCHIVGSTRLASVKGMKPFPNRSNPTQFTTVFPHDTHQDIIASVTKRNDVAVNLCQPQITLRMFP